MKNIPENELKQLFNWLIGEEIDHQHIKSNLYNSLQKSENYKDKFEIIQSKWSPYYFSVVAKDSYVRLFDVEVKRKKGGYHYSYFDTRSYDWICTEIKIECYNENVEQDELSREEQIIQAEKEKSELYQLGKECLSLILEKYPELRGDFSKLKSVISNIGYVAQDKYCPF